MTSDPAEPLSPENVANYIRDMADELVGLARAANLDEVAEALARARDVAASTFDLSAS